jgi:hypothetical protein
MNFTRTHLNFTEKKMQEWGGGFFVCSKQAINREDPKDMVFLLRGSLQER